MELNGVDHHVVAAGQGSPVVLLHALGGTQAAWYAVIERLALHRRAVAMDLRGHGRSVPAPGPYSVEGWADDVAALITSMDLGVVTVVGHSLSTLVAQQLAVTHPQLVDRLVLVGALEGPIPVTGIERRTEAVEKEGMTSLVDDWLERALASRTRATMPQVAGLMHELFSRNDPSCYAASLRALAEAPVIPHESITQPALLLVGDQDVSTPLASSEVLRARLGDARLRMIGDAAHWPMVDQPGSVARAILEFAGATRPG